MVTACLGTSAFEVFRLRTTCASSARDLRAKRHWGRRCATLGVARCCSRTPCSPLRPRPRPLSLRCADHHGLGQGPTFDRLAAPARFYFLHAYYFECERIEDAIAMAEYGGRFACAVRAGNVYGVQCHPEKSHPNGGAAPEELRRNLTCCAHGSSPRSGRGHCSGDGQPECRGGLRRQTASRRLRLRRVHAQRPYHHRARPDCRRQPGGHGASRRRVRSCRGRDWKPLRVQGVPQGRADQLSRPSAEGRDRPGGAHAAEVGATAAS